MTLFNFNSAVNHHSQEVSGKEKLLLSEKLPSYNWMNLNECYDSSTEKVISRMQNQRASGHNKQKPVQVWATGILPKTPNEIPWFLHHDPALYPLRFNKTLRQDYKWSIGRKIPALKPTKCKFLWAASTVQGEIEKSPSSKRERFCHGKIAKFLKIQTTPILDVRFAAVKEGTR